MLPSVCQELCTQQNVQARVHFYQFYQLHTFIDMLVLLTCVCPKTSSHPHQDYEGMSAAYSQVKRLLVSSTTGKNRTKWLKKCKVNNSFTHSHMLVLIILAIIIKTIIFTQRNQPTNPPGLVMRTPTNKVN